MLPLIVGAVLAACGLAFVLLPLLVGPARLPSSPVAVGRNPARWNQSVDLEDTTSGITAVEVLREIEFDRATGKLSDADYGTLKSTYTARALAELRAPVPRGANGQPGTDTNGHGPRRVCAMCAATSPPDAIYCARCAHYLARECPTCRGPVTLPAARYCSWCGGRLAARGPTRAPQPPTAEAQSARG
jgi:hypothetical protein